MNATDENAEVVDRLRLGLRNAIDDMSEKLVRATTRLMHQRVLDGRADWDEEERDEFEGRCAGLEMAIERVALLDSLTGRLEEES